MSENTLQDRLKEHAKAFDGLLSLIPAKYYYGEDTSNQWQRKKQTKEEAAAAKRAKLDPDSNKTAKDVMDERSKKRKLDETEESDVEGLEKVMSGSVANVVDGDTSGLGEIPKKGLKIVGNNHKKQKTEMKSSTMVATDLDKKDTSLVSGAEINSQAVNAKSEQKKLKLQRKKEKQSKRAEKRKLRKSRAAEETTDLVEDIRVDAEGILGIDEGGEALANSKSLEAIELENDRVGISMNDNDNQGLTASPSSRQASPTFDNPTNQSTATSTSSTIPPATAPKHIKIPTDTELLKSRLAARIEALRAARKADGPNGTPARNRQELMEARRKKEEQRRAHKKALRLKAKQEEEARREEALASARNSPTSSMMSSAIYGSSENNFSYGRITFSDGQQLSNDLAGFVSAPKRRGPQDPATALLAQERKKQRLAGMDEKKQAEIEEKDLWLNAKRRAHGVKVKDESSLLKKTLKRKEKAKKKSEKEWAARIEAVKTGQEIRQKKREENIKMRKEEKVSKGAKGKSGKGRKSKPKNRPGFEGSFVSGWKKR